MESSNEPHTPTQIVCLYAMRDEPMYRQLQMHLVLWRTKGYICWLELSAGADVEQTLLTFVQQADCVLLLMSSSFFVTSLYHRVMERALAEQAKRRVLVVPILARAFDWKESACGRLKVLPDNELPIAEWEHQERAYENIRVGLVRLLPGFATHMAALASRPKLFQARDLPNGYVSRPKAFDAIKHLLLNWQDNQTTAITTALHGAGGFGKTTLALALCHDPEIQATFPDGILWVELGEQPPRPLDVLNGLLTSLEESYNWAITLDEARNRWRTTLSKRICLLVIDDVWQASALETLLEGGSQCARLITTRNDMLLPEEATQVRVDAMEQEEAISVLIRGLSDEIHQAEYQPKLEALVARLGCWPLLLTLANGMLTSFVSYRQSLPGALTTIEVAYRSRGVSAFRQDNASERQKTVETCLVVSIQHLEESVPPHYHATERYQELAVFPEDTDIPLTTLHLFWKVTGGLEEWETDDLCIRLHRLSLLLTCDLGKGTVRLHDVMCSYLQQRTQPFLPTLHTHLLRAYWLAFGLQRWADLPSTDAYLWQHLIHHLCRTGYRDALQATLNDLVYLMRKALYVSVPALEAELLLASTFYPATATEPALSFFASLHRSIVHVSHLLLQARTPAEMGGILLSHLCWEPAFAAQRFPLEQEIPRPFLTAWRPLPVGSSSTLQRTFQSHTGMVTGCAVSPDGRWIVSASWDKTLKVWDVATGVERLTLIGHIDMVNSCAVSPDGRWIVSASGDKTLKVWDAATGTERLNLTGHTSMVVGCAVSPDGRWIVSASGDKTLKVWDAATGTGRLILTGHTDLVNSCAVSPNGRWIVSASWDKTLKVWDAATGVEHLTLIGHTDMVIGCAVSPDGRWIVSASGDKTLKVWDATTGAEQLTLQEHSGKTLSCVVSPDGRWIVSTSADKTLKVWDAITGAEQLTLQGHTSGVTGCAVSPDGRWIVSASGDKTLKVWDVTTGVVGQMTTLNGRTGESSCCAVSPDGRWIVSASGDKTLKVWNAATGVEHLTLIGHTKMVVGCAVSPDGRWVISTSIDKTLKVWDIATGVEHLTLTGHTAVVVDCAVSPDGRWIVSASGDKTLKVWDIATGVEHLALTGHTAGVVDCAVSPDGCWIVSASIDKTLKVWDATTGAERLTLIGHNKDLVNGGAIGVYGCAVSPDGRWIVSASGDKTLKVWDATTGAERLTLIGHTDLVNSCAVSPDGRWIVSASADHMLKLWERQSGRCVLTFPVDGELQDCAFYPDGEHLVVCDAHGLSFLRLVV